MGAGLCTLDTEDYGNSKIYEESDGNHNRHSPIEGACIGLGIVAIAIIIGIPFGLIVSKITEIFLGPIISIFLTIAIVVGLPMWALNTAMKYDSKK